MSSRARVLIVGAGISGAACAAALRGAGVDTVVHERGRAPGGRMASPTLHGRRVDIGAAYFTAQDDGFAAVVDGWQARGLVRPWTDTFDVFSAEGRSTTSGPQRWAATDGLRSLVRDLHTKGAAAGEVTLGDELTELPSGFDATVLAMPDPQAARLVGDLVDWVEYEPVIAVVAGWVARAWSFDAAFINDDRHVAMLADDGSRRGDGAAVLVAHTTADLARQHLEDPDGAIEPVLDSVQRLLGIGIPEWTHAHRWTFAKPAATHGDAPYALTDQLIGVCGDSWCPSGSPRVESAWLSGHRLGSALAERLA